MGETWVSIPKYPNYQISDLGRILNVRRGRCLRPSPTNHGYLRVNLCADGSARTTFVARLVCEIFNGASPSEHHQVAHKNGDKTDNRATNLYWATASDNAQDRVLHGTQAVGCHVHSKLTAQDAAAIRASSEALKTIMEKYGISLTMVVGIRSGRYWKNA